MDTSYPHAFVLNVMAQDRPGIVAAVSRGVFECRGNIDACSETVLGGYFTLIMIVSFPEPTDPDVLRRRIAEPDGRPGDLQVQVRPFEPVSESDPAGESFVITAFGPERTGLVLQFTRLLADKGINITDFYGARQEGQFIFIGQVRVPARWDVQMLQADLEQIAAEANFTVRIQHENVFVATNQLRMTSKPLFAR